MCELQPICPLAHGMGNTELHPARVAAACPCSLSVSRATVEGNRYNQDSQLHENEWSLPKTVGVHPVVSVPGFTVPGAWRRHRAPQSAMQGGYPGTKFRE